MTATQIYTVDSLNSGTYRKRKEVKRLPQDTNKLIQSPAVGKRSKIRINKIDS